MKKFIPEHGTDGGASDDEDEDEDYDHHEENNHDDTMIGPNDWYHYPQWFV